MSAIGFSSTDFTLALQGQNPVLRAGGVGKAQNAAGADAGESFAVRLATFKSQTLGALISPASGDFANPQAGVNALTGAQSDASDPLAALTAPGKTNGLSPTGRNNALFDPESAYRMMSIINGLEVSYKAQFAEMSDMTSRVAQMQQEGERLRGTDPTSDAASLAAQLQGFVDRYNDWNTRFAADMKPGGILAGTQAAEVARHELKASVENPFFGAAQGLHGLRDLGISIDPQTRHAVIDPAQRDATLAGNLAGAIQTVQAFGAHFARSAELLTSAGNFLPNRLNNLDRVIDYIGENSPALQAEFGRGDPAKPSGPVAAALAAYQKNSAA